MTILEALAHGPARPYELKFLTGLSNDEMVKALHPLRWPIHLIDWDNRNVWSITNAGRHALSARRRDRECTGVTAHG